ncbi:MAG: nucleotidyltransferase [Thermoproteus sp. AZ2]|jgi:predicted nucleotidyltransferase|uniref:Nucleotidyltransferase n=1 Tax=Thermoproteus sp. AZ2 TaxID=1609232 RepID=A0ACC6V0N9_9CREN
MDLEKYKAALREVGAALASRGVDFVLVGSAILPLVYKVEYDPGDVDLFIVNKSTILDYEVFEEIARENEWDMGSTDHGTIYYELIIGGDIVKVDLLENILDIYIPPQIIDNSIKIKIDDFEIKSIRIEDLLVLKAKMATKDAEDFINNVARLLADPKSSIAIDRQYIKAVVEYFSDKESILDRLNKNGIYID